MDKLLDLRSNEWHDVELLVRMYGHDPISDPVEGNGTAKIRLYGPSEFFEIKFPCCSEEISKEEFKEQWDGIDLLELFYFTGDPWIFIPKNSLDKEINDLKRMGYRRG